MHWRDGWQFTRMADGSVEILAGGALAAIPADEWASIVHAVAHPGADFYTIRAVLNGAPMRVDYTYDPSLIPETGPCNSHPPGVKCMACE
jgi:hypothetical protein